MDNLKVFLTWTLRVRMGFFLAYFDWCRRQRVYPSFSSSWEVQHDGLEKNEEHVVSYVQVLILHFQHSERKLLKYGIYQLVTLKIRKFIYLSFLFNKFSKYFSVAPIKFVTKYRKTNIVLIFLLGKSSPKHLFSIFSYWNIGVLYIYHSQLSVCKD